MCYRVHFEPVSYPKRFLDVVFVADVAAEVLNLRALAAFQVLQIQVRNECSDIFNNLN